MDKLDGEMDAPLDFSRKQPNPIVDVEVPSSPHLLADLPCSSMLVVPDDADRQSRRSPTTAATTAFESMATAIAFNAQLRRLIDYQQTTATATVFNRSCRDRGRPHRVSTSSSRSSECGGGEQDADENGYLDRRRKNNDSARRSRELRRAKEIESRSRVQSLEMENVQLRAQIALLRTELSQLQIILIGVRRPFNDHVPIGS